MVIVEYIWLGGKNELRSKTRVLETIDNLSKWNYDGSSTEQASGKDSEIVLHPHTVLKCPFRRNGENYIVMCSTHKPSNEPIFNNHREKANTIFKKYKEVIPWYGLEQEYFIINPKTNKPLGFPSLGRGHEQGQYYCSVGTHNAYGRELVEEHLDACVYAGIKISGINAEVAPGQWEFQVGPIEGILAGDHLWLARYILLRIAEKHNMKISFHPKPIKGNWNGSGCHTNFSTLAMREGTMEDGVETYGLYYINKGIKKLELKHAQHMNVYGEGNHLRMTGAHETSSYDKFTSGCGDRSCSVRIPNDTIIDGKGYFEDRRPSSNCDPYLVTSIICETVCCK